MRAYGYKCNTKRRIFVYNRKWKPDSDHCDGKPQAQSVDRWPPPVLVHLKIFQYDLISNIDLDKQWTKLKLLKEIYLLCCQAQTWSDRCN